MKLITPCPGCRQPVATTLPDTTSETEAQDIAGRLYCQRCAGLRLA